VLGTHRPLFPRLRKWDAVLQRWVLGRQDVVVYPQPGASPDQQLSALRHATRLSKKGYSVRLGAMLSAGSAGHTRCPHSVWKSDRCRAALSLALGYIAEDRGLDLADAIKKVQKMTPPRHLICHASSIVARLHPRGKPNEEFNHGTRPIAEEDAQLAVGCLSLVLKEIGWAKT